MLSLATTRFVVVLSLAITLKAKRLYDFYGPKLTNARFPCHLAAVSFGCCSVVSNSSRCLCHFAIPSLRLLAFRAIWQRCHLAAVVLSVGKAVASVSFGKIVLTVVKTMARTPYQNAYEQQNFEKSHWPIVTKPAIVTNTYKNLARLNQFRSPKRTKSIHAPYQNPYEQQNSEKSKK